MPTAEADDAAPPPRLTILALAELQDHLLSVVNDLSRLDVLLDEACTSLLERFHSATAEVGSLAGGDDGARRRALGQIAGAVTDLQFQDLARQLIDHACHRLVHCSDRLAAEAFGRDADGLAVIEPVPPRPNPVTQADMAAGSVDLF